MDNEALVAIQRDSCERTAHIVQEKWKAEHDTEEFAYFVNALYNAALRFVQTVIHFDDASGDRWLKSDFRSKTLRAVLPAYRLLREASETCAVDAFDYEVTQEKSAQLEAMVRALSKGIRLYDSKAEAQAIESTHRGATTLDGLERTLGDRLL